MPGGMGGMPGGMGGMPGGMGGMPGGMGGMPGGMSGPGSAMFGNMRGFGDSTTQAPIEKVRELFNLKLHFILLYKL